MSVTLDNDNDKTRGSGGWGWVVFDSVASGRPGTWILGLRGGMAGTGEVFCGRSGLGLTTTADSVPSLADPGHL